MVERGTEPEPAGFAMSMLRSIPIPHPLRISCAVARQDAAPPRVGRRDTPPSERGVARPWMGCPCPAEDRRQGPRRGEYCGGPSRQVQLHTGNKRVKPFADGPCGSMHRRPSAVLPPPPFPFAPKPQSGNPLPPGGTPLPEGGECSRTLHSPNAAPQSHRQHPRPLYSTKNEKFPTIGKIFSNHWKNAENFFQSLENRRKIFPIVGKLLEGVA